MCVTILPLFENMCEALIKVYFIAHTKHFHLFLLFFSNDGLGTTLHICNPLQMHMQVCGINPVSNMTYNNWDVVLLGWGMSRADPAKTTIKIPSSNSSSFKSTHIFFLNAHILNCTTQFNKLWYIYTHIYTYIHIYVYLQIFTTLNISHTSECSFRHLWTDPCST